MLDNSDIQSHKIMSMEEEKRERIFNAAITEFSKGFKNASTDVIVREAGISKGLLFHYFGTKRELYEFLLQYAYDLVKTYFIGFLNTNQRDLLQYLWQAILLKIDLSYKYPAIFDFLTSAYTIASEDKSSDIFITMKSMQTSVISEMFKNIDTSLFKDGLDIDKVTRIIFWTLTSYSETLAVNGKSIEEHKKDYDHYLAEIQSYFAIFRQAFYK